MGFVQAEQHAAVRQLTLCRPERRNAISRALATELAEAVRGAADDPTTAVIVLAAAGDVFLSGGDLDELLALPLDRAGAEAVIALGEEMSILESCAVPVLAAVTGSVFGGGAELVVMCDQVVMEQSATVQFVHGRLGLVPVWGGATRLAERVGEGRAADLLLTARPVPADEAKRLGLCAEVAPSGAGLETTLARAKRLADRGRGALSQLKRAALLSREARRVGALAAEREVFVSAWGSEPHRRAFARLAKSRRR